MQLNAYNYFRRMSAIGENEGQLAELSKGHTGGKDPQDDDALSIALSPTKIDFLK